MPHTLQAENIIGFLRVTDTLTQGYNLKYTHCTVGRFYNPPSSQTSFRNWQLSTRKNKEC